MIKKGRFENYCLKQVTKMAYYIQTLYQFEIISMKATFLMDDSQSIWFHYADDIVTLYLWRPDKKSPSGGQIETLQLKRLAEQVRNTSHGSFPGSAS